MFKKKPRSVLLDPQQDRRARTPTKRICFKKNHCWIFFCSRLDLSAGESAQEERVHGHAGEAGHDPRGRERRLPAPTAPARGRQSGAADATETLPAAAAPGRPPPRRRRRPGVAAAAADADADADADAGRRPPAGRRRRRRQVTAAAGKMAPPCRPCRH